MGAHPYMTTLNFYVCTIVQCLHQPATILNPGGRAFAKRHSSTQARGPILQASTSCHHTTTSSKSSSYSAQPQETQLNHFKHSQVSPPLSLTSPKIIITHSSDWNWHIHCPIVHNDNNNKDTKPFLSSSPGAHLFNPKMFFASKMVSGEQSSLFKTDRRHYSGINHPHCLVLIIHPADWC